MTAATTFEYQPLGPFDLANQNQYFGGWLTSPDDPDAIVMAFPVEGWQSSAAVVLRQAVEGPILGQVYGPAGLAAQAQQQALVCLSLDIPAESWPEVGRRDEVIGGLQGRYGFLRPVLFHSPYEAAAAFVIGHRISVKQRQALVRRMSAEIGEPLAIGAQTFHAFPNPQTLLGLTTYPGLSDLKIERLRGVAQAALNGLLDRARLHSLPVAQALAELQSLAGIGPFFAQGILHRGAGLVDEVTDEDVTQYAVQTAYHLNDPPDRARLLEIAEAWRPFRMWATVLLHVWVRREVGLPSKRTFTPRKP